MSDYPQNATKVDSRMHRRGELDVSNGCLSILKTLLATTRKIRALLVPAINGPSHSSLILHSYRLLGRPARAER